MVQSSHCGLCVIAAIAGLGCEGPLPEARVGSPCPAIVMREVNDQWIAAHDDPGDNLWHKATYFTGNLAAAGALDQSSYRAFARSWARGHAYGVNGGTTTDNADNHCAGQTYLALYELDPQPEMMRGIKNAIDYTIDTGDRDQWYWIDAQFMASPVFAQLGALTGGARYHDAMFEMYIDARDRRQLYDPTVGLWFRDGNYLYPDEKTPNGKKIFWARGNGWVIGSLVRTLDYLAADSPYRAEYETMLQAMASALADVQRGDGLWNVSLADPEDHPGPEASGTAFFTYAIAWGINRGVLDRATFLPIVERAWRGLASVAVRADGELGYVQGVGERPNSSQPVTIRSTHDYGVGAFLLAGSEVMQLGVDFECP